MWKPGTRRDCQAFVVGTKVVIQPVCSHTQAVAERRPHIRCDGLQIEVLSALLTDALERR